MRSLKMRTAAMKRRIQMMMKRGTTQTATMGDHVA